MDGLKVYNLKAKIDTKNKCQFCLRMFLAHRNQVQMRQYLPKVPSEEVLGDRKSDCSNKCRNVQAIDKLQERKRVRRSAI